MEPITRSQYVLRKVSNGWIVTPDAGYIAMADVPHIRIFRTLHEFANWVIGSDPPEEIKPTKKRRKTRK